MPPNSTNNFFGVKISKQGVPVNQASDKQLISKDDFSTRTFYDDNNSRMLEGKLPDGSYGLWVSKPGIDVTTATLSNLVFNSNTSFTVVATNTHLFASLFLAMGSGSQYQSVTIPHNLGFTPAFDFYTPVFYPAVAFIPPLANNTTTQSSLFQKGVNGVTNIFIYPGALDEATYSFSAYIDATNLYIIETATAGNVQDGTLIALPISYYIYSAQVA